MTSDRQQSRVGDAQTEQQTEIDDKEIELLKGEYMSLRDEVRMRIKEENRRFVRGLAVIGVLLGYGASSGHLSIVTAAPFILGFLYIESARTFHQLGNLSHQMLRIEDRLQNISQLFNWEHEYGGMFGVGNGILDYTPYRIPSYTLILIGVVSYAGLSWVSYRFWPPKLGYWPVKQRGLAIILILYSVIIAVAWVSSVLYVKELSKQTS